MTAFPSAHDPCGKFFCEFRCHNSGPQDGFRYFWLSDSCPQTVRDVRNKAPFEVLSLAGPIASALQI